MANGQDPLARAVRGFLPAVESGIQFSQERRRQKLEETQLEEALRQRREREIQQQKKIAFQQELGIARLGVSERQATAQERRTGIAEQAEARKGLERRVLIPQEKITSITRLKPGEIPIIVKPSKKPGDTKVTKGQARTAAFANRVAEAEVEFRKILDAGFDPTSTTFSLQRRVPERFKPQQVKQQEQAERSFANAILREESGAVIGPSEFESARLQYFPQPGDGKEVLEQKRKNREIVFEALRAAAEGKLPSLGQFPKPTTIAEGQKQFEQALAQPQGITVNIQTFRTKEAGEAANLPSGTIFRTPDGKFFESFED